jgi:hypothetical protein
LLLQHGVAPKLASSERREKDKPMPMTSLALGDTSHEPVLKRLQLAALTWAAWFG